MAGTYASVINENADLIRKGLNVAVFIAPESETTEITDLLDASDQLDIPAAYSHVGLIEKDQGATWSSDVENSDVNSVGHAEPTRRDITSDVTGLQFTAQESKALTIGLFEGMDLSGVKAKAAGSTHSTVSYDKPDRPAPIRHRVLVLAKDGDGPNAFYFAKWLPNCQVTDKSEQEWKEDTEVQYNVTLTAFLDAEFGTSVRTLWGIPTAQVEAMGF